MAVVAAYYKSTVGKKTVMAVTGIVLFLFVIGHMIGNLSLYGGPEKLNGYAKLLRTSMPLLWTIRGILLLIVGTHIYASYQLWLTNRSARAVPYRIRKDRRTTYSARTMIWSGPILLLFIAYHIMHLTLGAGVPGFDSHDVYHNVVASFSLWYVSAFYIVAMVALGFHMSHGVWSLFQTLGWNHPKYNPIRRQFATGITWIVVIGNIMAPVSVLTGLVH